MRNPRAGRPPKNIIVPHPVKGDEWLQVGGYDKTWPAANRYWILRREGNTRREALETAAKEFSVSENSLDAWLHRTRKRGPISSDGSDFE